MEHQRSRRATDPAESANSIGQTTSRESPLPNESTPNESPEHVHSPDTEGSNPKGTEKQKRPEKHKDPAEPKDSTDTKDAKETKDAIRATWNGIDIMFYEDNNKWGCICGKGYATRKALRSHFFGPAGGSVPKCTQAMQELADGVTPSRQMSNDFYFARVEKRARREDNPLRPQFVHVLPPASEDVGSSRSQPMSLPPSAGPYHLHSDFSTMPTHEATQQSGEHPPQIQEQMRQMQKQLQRLQEQVRLQEIDAGHRAFDIAKLRSQVQDIHLRFNIDPTTERSYSASVFYQHAFPK